jgi:predicted nicotinamide N-methyase
MTSITSVLRTIGRVKASRLLPSELLLSSSVHLELSIVSEFFSAPVDGFVIACCRWDLHWKSIDRGSVDCISVSKMKVRSGSGSIVLSFRTPSVPGTYCLSISCVYDHEDSYSVMILPLTTDMVSVNDNPIDGKYIFSCIREIAMLSFDTDHVIRIREEYGTALGSHLWDSSIVLFRYMQMNCSSTLFRGRVAVELGAGLGLCGVWLSKYSEFQKVCITDKADHMSFIQANIDLNDCQTAEALCINWSSNSDSYRNQIGGIVDLIIAADVLYDDETATQGLATAKGLLTGGTPFLVAQKIRGPKSASRFIDLIEQAGFIPTCLCEEAGVCIWSLECLTSSSTSVTTSV